LEKDLEGSEQENADYKGLNEVEVDKSDDE